MPAANDHLASALVITGASGSTVLDFTGATYIEAGSPSESDFFGATSTSLWVRWTAPADDDVAFELTSGAPDEWLLYVASDAADWDGWISGLITGGFNGPVGFSATAGTTYLICIFDYTATTGSGAPSTASTLAWAHYTPPPPPPDPPTVSNWESSGSYNTHVMFPGDTATLHGTGFDLVTTVTVGGVAQTFDIVSSTEITVHIAANAGSGPIHVWASSGDVVAPASAIVLHPGPWVQPADASATTGPAATVAYGTSSVSGESVFISQPDLTGYESTSLGVGGSLQVSGYHVGPNTWEWFIGGLLMIVDARRTGPEMRPAALPTGVYDDPHVVDVQLEADTGNPVSDATVAFNAYCNTGQWLDDENKNPGNITTHDMWLLETQFRALPAGTWDGVAEQLVPNSWPSRAALTALAVDAVVPVTAPGSTLELVPDAFDYYRTNGHISLVPGPDPGYVGEFTLTWTELVTGRAWAVALSNLVDGPDLTPPLIGPDTDFTGNGVQNKNVSPHPDIRITWIYRPPRYRLLYDTPPTPPATATLRRRQQAARTGSAPRRRQVAARTSSPRRGPGAAP